MVNLSGKYKYNFEPFSNYNSINIGMPDVINVEHNQLMLYVHPSMTAPIHQTVFPKALINASFLVFPKKCKQEIIIPFAFNPIDVSVKTAPVGVILTCSI